jgi:hypothetical protein
MVAKRAVVSSWKCSCRHLEQDHTPRLTSPHIPQERRIQELTAEVKDLHKEVDRLRNARTLTQVHMLVLETI